SPHAAVIAAPMPSLARWPAIRRPELPSQTPKNIFAPLPKARGASKGIGSTKRNQSLSDPPTARPSAPESAVYVPPPPPPAPPPPSPEEIAAEQARRQGEMAIQQARQQLTQYRFLGYLTTNGEPQGFVGKGQDLFIVRNGEVLEGQVVVSQIE